MKKDILMKKSFALILLISLVAALILGGLRESKKEQQSNEGNATLVIKSIGKTTTENFSSKDATAMDLLKYRHKLKTTIGGYIKCIDDVCVHSDYNWAFYVNNKSISLSASSYKVKDDDIIRFEFTRLDVGAEKS